MNDFLSCLTKQDKKIAVMISDYVPGQWDRAELSWEEVREGQGDRQGVLHRLLVSSHCSSCLTSSCGVGPPPPQGDRPLVKNSRAVVRSHIWMAPLLWPVRMNLRGLEPILLLPSHSWTQKLVMIDPSTDLRVPLVILKKWDILILTWSHRRGFL